MARIDLKDVAKSFGKTAVLGPTNLEIFDGEFFCLVGPSGCGKTTLLNLIAGLEPVSSGDVNFDGVRVTGLPPRERDVAMVFQSYALYPHMSVRENLAFPLKVRGLGAAEIARRVEATSSLLGLRELLDRRPKQLSGGQQQRVALGRALIRKPKVFLMDEPLSNLDAKLRTQMRVELKRLHRDVPVTTVYVTHDQEEALSLSDRMAVLHKGRIQQIGAPEQVYERPANLFVARFVGKPEINVFEGSLFARHLRVSGGEFRLDDATAERLSKAGPKLLVGIRPEHVALAEDGPEARVEVVEPMGSETWVELTLDGARLTAKVPGRFEGKPGASVHLSIDPARLHYFHPQDETRL